MMRKTGIWIYLILFVSGSVAQAATVAYWRFEEGPVDTPVSHGGLPDGAFFPGVLDVSGNGNHLSVWAEGWAGFVYRSDVPSPTVWKTGAANVYSVQNSGTYPSLFTSSPNSHPTGIDLDTWTPAVFTIEVAFKPESGGWRTIIGRDARNVATANDRLAALYFQITPQNAMAIKFADVSGYWHEAQSVDGVIQGFPFPDADQGRWYYAAAVCNGQTLSLYLADVAGGGYQLVAQTDLTAGGSPDRRLTAGDPTWTDWPMGIWSVGRGMYDSNHTDRAYGLIDEVRISDTALNPSDFLFYQVSAAGLLTSPDTPTVKEDGSDSVDVLFSLEYEPSASVTLHLAEQLGRNQVALDRNTLVFTTTNWNAPQAIRVTGVDDTDLESAEQKIALSVTVTSADPDYAALNADPVVVTVLEDECGAYGYAAADLTLDCVVDLQDLLVIVEQWLSCSVPGQGGCTDFNGMIP